ncbi:hypothetical protein TKK_0003030 [Trichogramma kaykai]
MILNKGYTEADDNLLYYRQNDSDDEFIDDVDGVNSFAKLKEMLNDENCNEPVNLPITACKVEDDAVYLKIMVEVQSP